MAFLAGAEAGEARDAPLANRVPGVPYPSKNEYPLNSAHPPGRGRKNLSKRASSGLQKPSPRFPLRKCAEPPATTPNTRANGPAAKSADPGIEEGSATDHRARTERYEAATRRRALPASPGDGLRLAGNGDSAAAPARAPLAMLTNRRRSALSVSNPSNAKSPGRPEPPVEATQDGIPGGQSNAECSGLPVGRSPGPAQPARGDDRTPARPGRRRGTPRPGGLVRPTTTGAQSLSEATNSS